MSPANSPPGFADHLCKSLRHLRMDHHSAPLQQDPDGTDKLYFLKCANGDNGRLMVEGEFNAQGELYKTMPERKTYFFLSEFINMSGRVPEPNQLCTKLARLHRDSVSPTGMFGFHATTCQGITPQDVSWELNGVWEDLNILAERALELVIPRLIGALEAEGRRVKPCLIHADLWEGNTGTSLETGRIHIFESAAFYAHNEMETGNWRCTYNKIHNKVYTLTYLRHFAPSEPRQEWDDRNRMYSVYYNVIYSVNHKSQGAAVRQTAYDDLYYLVDKSAPFEEGRGPQRLVESDRARLSDERDHTRA
ncbi:Fructosamine kinase-domain-containing protein [Aspergillus karnatakaensis]|uniref:Fructosamine kinase-domain-containing protein n=1 Tax=Aspergillus karnatakaensis TaxID=1810916 RepID=UPI003CCD4827